MFSGIFDAIETWLKGLLISTINSNLTTMFADINAKTGDIAAQVGQTPQEWNSGIFSMIQSLSETVMIPIAGLIITAVLCWELISMVTDRNNLNDVDTWMFFRYFVKMYLAVIIVSNTPAITQGVFELGKYLADKAATVIKGDTQVSIEDMLEQMTEQMQEMEVGPLLTLTIESFVAKLCMTVISIVITVVVYGRMIEIYLYTSVAPVTFATVGNREWGQIGSNYFRSLIALAFQAFLMMICVGIYAAMVSSIELSDNMRQALLQIIISTVVLCYSLMRTGTFSRSLFQAH